MNLSPARLLKAYADDKSRAMAVKCRHLPWVRRSAFAMACGFAMTTTSGFPTALLSRLPMWIVTGFMLLAFFLGPSSESFYCFRSLTGASRAFTWRVAIICFANVLALMCRFISWMADDVQTTSKIFLAVVISTIHIACVAVPVAALKRSREELREEIVKKVMEA